MLQYPLLVTWPNAIDYFYNKEDIDMNSNLVTESKVRECNRMSLTIFMQKSMSQALQEEYGQDYARACPRDVWNVSRHEKVQHIIEK